MTIEKTKQLIEGNEVKIAIGLLIAFPLLLPLASAAGTLVGWMQ